MKYQQFSSSCFKDIGIKNLSLLQELGSLTYKGEVIKPYGTSDKATIYKRSLANFFIKTKELKGIESLP